MQRATEEDELQAKPSVQRKGDGSFEMDEAFQARLNETRGSGSPLPAETREFMESRMGVDFSGVRVHTGSEGAQLSQDVQAQAFTHGSDIYFNEGKYNPNSSDGQQLLAHELTHTIQQTGGVQRQANVIQRKPLTLGSVKRSVELRGSPNSKGKKASKTLYRNSTALKALDSQPVADEKDPNKTWRHVEIFSGEQRGTQGYVPSQDYGEWGTKEDTELGHTIERTGLRDKADKTGAAKGALDEGTLVQLINPTVTSGYYQVQVLTGSSQSKQGYIRQDKLVKENLPIALKESRWFHKKDTQIIGESKAGSFESRHETEKALHVTSGEAAQQIFTALTSGFSKLTAFQKIAFLLAGQPGGKVTADFKQLTHEDLRETIKQNFAGDPGPEAHNYLLDLLDHDGTPSLKFQILVAVGDVDSSGSFSKAITNVPVLGGKLGVKGDTVRVFELIENAPRDERHQIWRDRTLMARLSSLDDKSRKAYERLEAQINVEKAEIVIEQKKEKGLTITTADTQTLAMERDAQLALLFTHNIKKLPVIGKAIGLETTKLYDDLLEWKSKATQDDLNYIKQPTSKFQQALAQAPTNFLMGLRQKERDFLTTFLDTVDTSGSQTQVKAVVGGLKRQKNIVHRGTNRGWLGTKVSTAMTEKKWPEIENEIKLLNEEQRAEVLKAYDPTPSQALTLLEADLKAAGFDKESRARILAMFRTLEFGTPGGAYVDLWELVEPGKKTRLKHRFTKEALKGQSQEVIAKAAFKIIMDLEGEEYAQVRQDKDLLRKIKAVASPKTWGRIMTLLGMQDENDQLPTGLETRVQAQIAEERAELNPKHWAVKLDKQIEESEITKKITAGSDKSSLFVLITNAQYAAQRAAAKDPNNDPKFLAGRFLQDVLNELEQINAGKVTYLQTKVPVAYAALKENKPITVETRLKRAKYEGSFGKANRQGVVMSFMHLQGRPLLDEWSNLGAFIQLGKDLKEAEGDAALLSEIVMNFPPQPTKEEQKKHDEAEEQLLAHFAHMAQLQTAMKNFTLGINDERRKDLKALRIKAEDRIKIEGMVTDKLVKAMKKDPEVQDALTEAGLPFDEYMQQKMKGVDALQMQRLLDTTRQWHAFSTKGSQLDEGTRNVKSGITSTESQLREAEPQRKSKEQIKEIREKGAKKTEEALEDRTMLEARFRDMQATFRERAMLIFKLIALAIITGLTMGVGAPLSIGLQVAIEAGMQVLEAAFRYFVLGETQLSRLAVNFALGLVKSTTSILTANLSFALQAEMLNAGGFFEAAPWVAKPIGATVANVINRTVMFAPNYIVKKFYQDKELEKVIEEGEDTIGEAVAKEAQGALKGFVTKTVLGAVRFYKGELTGGGAPPPTDTRNFGQVYTDRLMGGGSQEEQERMWGRYEKGYKKDAKKQFKKVVDYKKGQLSEVTEATKEVEKEQRKDKMKEIRGKEKKSSGYKTLKDAVEDKRLAFKKDFTGETLTLLTNQKLTVVELETMSSDEKGKIEELLGLSAGKLDTILMDLNITIDESPQFKQVRSGIEGWTDTMGGGIGMLNLSDLVELGLVAGDALAQLNDKELAKLALILGMKVSELRSQINNALAQV